MIRVVLLPLVLALAVTLEGAAAQSGPRFASRQHVLPDMGLLDLAVADLNGDGRSDVVAGGSGGLVVFTALANGLLKGPVYVPLSGGVTSLALADLNADGAPEALVGLSGQVPNDDGLYLLRGDGQGGFGKPIQVLSGFLPWSIGVAPMNADAHLDLVLCDIQGDALRVFLSNGAGGFAPLAPVSFAPFAPVTLEVGDLDGDGDHDVITAFDTQVVILANDGAGGLTTIDAHTLPYPAHDLAIGHMDADAFGDIVAGYGDWSLFLNQGDGTFAPGTQVSHFSAERVELADWDQDGALDVLAGSIQGGGLHCWRGDGLGGVGPQERLPVSSTISGVRQGDANGDGRVDLFTSVWTEFTIPSAGGSVEPFDKLGVLLGDGGGGVQRLVQSPPDDPVLLGFGPSWSLATDVTGDGRADLLGHEWGGPRLALRRGRTDGTFGPSLVVRVPHDVYEVRVADVDGDQFLDLVAIDHAPAVSVLPGDGAGGFGAPVTSPIAVFPVNFGGARALADWNVDGRDDLLHVTDELRVYLAQSNGSFALGPVFGGLSSTTAIVAVDLDQNGGPDVVVRSQFTASVLYNDGSGGLASLVPTSFPSNTTDLVAGDMNADGWPDVAFGQYGDIATTEYELGLRYNDGSGQLLAPRLFPVGLHPSALAILDVDADGVNDLVGSIDSGAFAVLPGSTAFALKRQAHYGTWGDNEKMLGVADVNGDGRADRIGTVGSATGGHFPVVHLNQGP